MARSDEDSTGGPARRIIFRTRENVQAVRNQYHRERVNGSVSDETHRELASAALMYRDVLAEHSSEGVVADKWEDSGVDGLEALVGQTATVEVKGSGRTSNTRQETRPAVLTVPHTQIYQATKALDTLAKELGFAASARSKTDHTETEADDLMGLLRARGQETAAQNLPARFHNSGEQIEADGGEDVGE